MPILGRQAQHGEKEIARPHRLKYSESANLGTDSSERIEEHYEVNLVSGSRCGQRTQRLSHTSERTTPPLVTRDTVAHQRICVSTLRAICCKVFRDTLHCTRSGPDGYGEYTEFDNGFFALLESVLWNRTAYMLLDHKDVIGYRIVERIVVFGKKGVGDHE